MPSVVVTILTLLIAIHRDTTTEADPPFDTTTDYGGNTEVTDIKDKHNGHHSHSVNSHRDPIYSY